MSQRIYAMKLFCPVSPRLAGKHLFHRSIWNRYRQNSSLANESGKIEKITPKPSYDITFTCKICMKRSTHRMSKQAYHRGTVLIECPTCRNRHLIADNLKIFHDKNITIEDIMKQKGELVAKGLHIVQDASVEITKDQEDGPNSKSRGP